MFDLELFIFIKFLLFIFYITSALYKVIISTTDFFLPYIKLKSSQQIRKLDKQSKTLNCLGLRICILKHSV